jgi:hypothetical protein
MAYFSDASMGLSAMSHANFDNCLGIYYQNVRGLRNKQLEFYDNLCASNFEIICLSRQDSMTCAMITIYFLTNTPFTGLTGHI